MNVHTWERAVVAALNGIEGGKPPLNDGSKRPWTTAVLSALSQAGNRLGFYTCATGGKKVDARWEAWLWDCVWREIEDEESWMLLSVPMVSECEWQTDGWNIRQDFHKLLAANSLLRVFVFNGGDAERGREVAGRLCDDIAAMRVAPSQDTRFVLAAREVLARPAFRIFRANAQGEILRELPRDRIPKPPLHVGVREGMMPPRRPAGLAWTHLHDLCQGSSRTRGSRLPVSAAEAGRGRDIAAPYLSLDPVRETAVRPPSSPHVHAHCVWSRYHLEPSKSVSASGHPGRAWLAIDHATRIVEHRPSSADGRPAMTRPELCACIVTATTLSKAGAAAATDALFSAIAAALARGEPLTVMGFGKFTTRDRPARTGRNPQTGEAVAIAASRAPAFNAGKALRNAVNIWLEGAAFPLNPAARNSHARARPLPRTVACSRHLHRLDGTCRLRSPRSSSSLAPGRSPNRSPVSLDPRDSTGFLVSHRTIPRSRANVHQNTTKASLDFVLLTAIKESDRSFFRVPSPQFHEQ